MNAQEIFELRRSFSEVPLYIHIFHHNDGTDKRLTEISAQLAQILGNQKTMAANLDQLTADVAAETTVDQSAITLLQGLKAALDAAGTDPVKLAALSTSLETNQAALSAAITANTPTP